MRRTDHHGTHKFTMSLRLPKRVIFGTDELSVKTILKLARIGACDYMKNNTNGCYWVSTNHPGYTARERDLPESDIYYVLKGWM